MDSSSKEKLVYCPLERKAASAKKTTKQTKINKKQPNKKNQEERLRSPVPGQTLLECHSCLVLCFVLFFSDDNANQLPRDTFARNFLINNFLTSGAKSGE